MRTVLAYPGNMAHAQHSARALAEHGALQAFVTTFVFRPDGRLASALARLPDRVRRRASAQLARRGIGEVPAGLVHSYPAWEVLRTAAMKLNAGPVATDLMWDRMSHSFDALIARRYVPRAHAIQAFEYTALAAFQRAVREGVAKVLHLPSLDSKRYDEIERREKQQWRELVSGHDSYFESKFQCRYERRCQEIALADVVIANSALTARSHIAAGAQPDKVLVVPLGAPPPIAEARVDALARHRPLRAIWAGPFSLRKGAHYLLEAWRRLAPGAAATLDVYGLPALPERLRATDVDSIRFLGTVPQPVLFEAFEQADVLLFPTLSDGFGMVVAEAMAHGLPVITTDQAGAADLVTERNGLIVSAADPRALADALAWCLDNRERLQEMRHHALETARHRQWSHFRQDLVRALDTGLRRAGYTPEFRLLH